MATKFWGRPSPGLMAFRVVSGTKLSATVLPIYSLYELRCLPRVRAQHTQQFRFVRAREFQV